MKKFIFAFLASIFLFGNVAFANEEEIINYSLMNAPLPEMVYEAGEITEVDYDVPVLLSDGLTAEEIIYQSFDALSPENIESATVYKNNDGLYYAKIPIPIYFLRDDSLGTVEEQFYMILDAIHEVYARFLSDNPEYFYLIPRNYSGSATASQSYLTVNFEPLICLNFPDFDASEQALEDLKTKYDNLMTVINNTADELMFDGMTDLDKLLLAHDYIIDNCAYYREDKEDGTVYYGDGYSYNAYGILVNKKGVCQGLSYAYPALLKAMGYPIENIRQIRSDELIHMWNFVKLGDNWYHVDLTWDDPCVVAKEGDLYDMNDESLQYEYHNHFLMSDETNTARRNAKGEYNFTLEILGYDDNDHILADDKTFESGYIFNDFIFKSVIPGKVEYKNGQYKKYYINDPLYFTFDSLKALDYAVSYPMVKQNGNINVLVLGSRVRECSNLPVNFYVCHYDKDGRFLKAEKYDRTFSAFGEYQIGINKTDATKQIKIMTFNEGTVKPIANVSLIK